MESQALWLTLRLAGTTTIILLGLAIPLAWWIASGRGALRAVVQAIVALPLVLPPTVIGFYLLIGLGPLTWLGRALARMLGHQLAFSFAGLLVGSIIYSLPFAVQPLIAGFKSIDSEYGEAAAGIGMSPLSAFLQVILPMTQSSLAAATVLTFTHTVGEFGVVLMLGGNIPGLTRTLSLELFDQVQDFSYAAANRTAAVMVVVALLGSLLVYGRWSSRDADVL
jgi:molybdate transport system permease protein